MLDPADGWRRSWQEDLTLETDLRIHSTDDHSSYCSKPSNWVTLQDVFSLDYLTLFIIVNVNEPWREKGIEVSGNVQKTRVDFLLLLKPEPASRLWFLIFTRWRNRVNRRRYRNNSDTHHDAPPDQPAIPQFLFLAVVLLTTWSHCTQCKVVAEYLSLWLYWLLTNYIVTGKKYCAAT